MLSDGLGAFLKIDSDVGTGWFYL